MEIKDVVYGFKTKNKEGFIQSEIYELLIRYPEINIDKFNDALSGISCLKIDGSVVIYHHDIEKALGCGLENRFLSESEFD